MMWSWFMGCTQQSSAPDLVYPFLMMMMTTPSSRMRTTRPPAHTPRIKPISSECWETPKGSRWSLQAATSKNTGNNARMIRQELRCGRNCTRENKSIYCINVKIHSGEGFLIHTRTYFLLRMWSFHTVYPDYCEQSYWIKKRLLKAKPTFHTFLLCYFQKAGMK